MQTCSRCNATSPDQARQCTHCNADLQALSTTALALKRMRENPRVRLIRVSVAHDGCPHCYGMMKTYSKENVPSLPHAGCSHPNGCRCTYEPVLSETALVGKVVQ